LNPAIAVVPERRSTLLLLLLLLPALLLSGCGDGSGAAGGESGSESATAPGLVLLEEGPVELDHFRGQWLFVNYWAEWCAPCLEEIPELNAFHAEQEDARVLGINYDRLEASVMRGQVAKLEIRFPVAVGDPGELLNVSLPEVLPSTYVFDPEGRRVDVLRGPQDRASLEAVMRSE
jgi:thiol-disulfide isomerase/thioredoxin